MSNLHPSKENGKTKDRGGYPQRQPFFAQRVIRAMTKTAAAQEIGATGFALVSLVAAQEDAKRYTGPVTYYNGQLSALLGIRKWETLDATRARVVAAGWLHYDAPPAGSRTVPGAYWTLIPIGMDSLNDSPCDESDAIEASYRRGFDAGYLAGQRGEPYPFSGDSEHDNIRFSDTVVERSRIRSWNEGGYGRGELPYPIPIPIPSPRPGQGPDVLSSGNHRRIRQPSYTEADMATAQWIWERIHQMQPGRKTPNFDKWANAVRLMREQDGRTDEEIRALFTRVQADAFWSKNVLSPDTLRSKWDDLQLRLRKTNGKPASQPSIYKPLTPIV